MNKGQISIFGQPKFLIMVIAIILGFLIGNSYYSQGILGSFIGVLIALFLWKFF